MPNVPDPRPAPPALVPETTALFLDVDGVLLGFSAQPDRVVVPDALLARLRELQLALGGALALVSGRNIATLDALFAPLRLPSAGLHGLERRNGDDVRSVVADTSALDGVRAAAREIVARHPGALCEDKGMAVALHWRAAPAAADELRALAERAADALPGHHLQPGDSVVELKPVGADKGSAIEAFLQEPPFAGRTPVFLGDDLTDEHGFATVNRYGGTSILVGNREPSVAQFALSNVAAVHRWLGVHGAMQPQVAA